MYLTRLFTMIRAIVSSVQPEHSEPPRRDRRDERRRTFVHTLDRRQESPRTTDLSQTYIIVLPLIRIAVLVGLISGPGDIVAACAYVRLLRCVF